MRDNQVRSGTIRYTQVLSKTLYLYHDSTVFNSPKSPNSLVSPKSPNSPTTSPKAYKNGLLSRKEAVETIKTMHAKTKKLDSQVFEPYSRTPAKDSTPCTA